MTDAADGAAPAAALAQLALAMVEHEHRPDAAMLRGQAARALAWAIKELCFASWSSDPQRAVRAAQALGRLREAVAGEGGAALQQEIDALAAWTSGIAGLIQGDMAGAVDRLDAAAAGFAAIDQPLHAAHTQVPKIMALSMLGRQEAAVACADATQRVMLAQGDTVGAGRVSLNLANLHLRSDRYAEAAPRFREAAALFARHGDHERSVMSDLGLGDTQVALGDPDEAALTYERARMRAAAHRFPVLQAMADESQALLGLARGHYREALAGLLRARQGYAALEMPQQLAIAEKQLADAYLELRLLPEALAGFSAAMQRFRELGMEVDLAWTAVQRGRALALAGRPAAAQAALAEGAALFAAQHNSVGVASVALARAELALSQSDARQALALAGEAAAAFRRSGPLERELRADSVSAQALLELQQIDAARRRFDATLAAAQAHQLLPLQLRCRTGRALAAYAAGDVAAARADLEAAALMFEEQRRTLPGDEVRSAFQTDHLPAFQALLRLELEPPQSQARSDGAGVLAQLDRIRARTLADRLAGQRPDPADADPLRAWRARLAWLYRRLQRLQDEGGDSAALSAQLRTTERELLERARRARLADARAVAVGDEAELDVAALRRCLAAQDALVEYGVVDDELLACIVTPHGVQVQRRMASWREVQQALHSVHLQIETLRHGRERLQQHLPMLLQRAQQSLRRLHALVWQPLVPALHGVRRVLVVAPAQLGALPFCALHDGEGALVDRHDLAFAPSARMALRGLARRDGALRRVLALGESSRLPHAAREARAVAALLAQGQALVGAEATLVNLRRHAAAADVIHFACHAQFRGDNPMFSALHLHDGPLTAEAVEALHLRAAVVVLSACETALHAPQAGDEAFGLTRAFLVAGAGRVMASLWAVDDATTSELMADFYAGLQRGLGPAAALRQAQLAARQKHGHPFHWASFSLIGGW